MPRVSLDRPFPEYKWRWAVLTPSESFNDPSVLLGVLRALRNNEGHQASSPGVQAGLLQVEKDLQSTVSLARSRGRNLLRNSQQYWSSVGLLATTRGGIQLTSFGQKVADGDLSRADFAASVVLEHELPNVRIETAETVAAWRQANLRIKPFRLLLEICLGLHDVSPTQSFLKKDELRNVIVPLAGVSADVAEHVQNVLDFRLNPASFAHYPNCSPRSNDHRMLGEFLLFLGHHGFLQQNSNGAFYLMSDDVDSVRSLLMSGEPVGSLDATAKLISTEGLLGTRAQDRMYSLVENRPNQKRFRRQVLDNSISTCLLTSESIPEVLEAAHVRPHHLKGSDDVSNGVCLRRDVHRLFDAGHIRISAGGSVHLSTVLQDSRSYRSLPTNIQIPDHVDTDQLRWRHSYYG